MSKHKRGRKTKAPQERQSPEQVAWKRLPANKKLGVLVAGLNSLDARLKAQEAEVAEVRGYLGETLGIAAHLGGVLDVLDEHQPEVAVHIRAAGRQQLDELVAAARGEGEATNRAAQVLRSFAARHAETEPAPGGEGPKPLRWTYSTDEESWPACPSYATREEAEVACVREMELSPGDVFWVGTRQDIPVTAFQVFEARVSSILEDVSEQAEQLAGEAADEWPDTTSAEDEALRAALTQVLQAWIAEHCSPSFWTLESCERCVAPGGES